MYKYINIISKWIQIYIPNIHIYIYIQFQEIGYIFFLKNNLYIFKYNWLIYKKKYIWGFAKSSQFSTNSEIFAILNKLRIYLIFAIYCEIFAILKIYNLRNFEFSQFLEDFAISHRLRNLRNFEHIYNCRKFWKISPFPTNCEILAILNKLCNLRNFFKILYIYINFL